MQLKTILNRVEPFKSFVYGTAQWLDDGEHPVLLVALESRKNGRPRCSGGRTASVRCGRVRPGYHRLPTRLFEFVPLWGIPVYFVYARRRVDCGRTASVRRECGVKVERVPWCDGKNELTTTSNPVGSPYRWFLARWAKRLSWQEVAETFHTTWENVFRSVAYAVSWGLSQRVLSGVRALGIDEIQWRLGHHYLTLVYQIDDGLTRRTDAVRPLLWIGRERTEESLRGFFAGLDREIRLGIRFVCSATPPGR